MHTVKGHNERESLRKPQSRTFSSASYLEGLMAELDRAAICSRIHEARKQSGLTQEEMAEAMLVHRRTVQNWESPKLAIVPWDRLDGIARLTGTTREWLLHGQEAEQATPAQIQAVLEEVQASRAEVQAVREIVEALQADRAPATPGRRRGSTAKR